MIWDSIPLMTGFDASILIIAYVAFNTTWRSRRLLTQAHLLFGMFVIISGLILMGLFCLADLVTMWVMPLFTTQQTAMKAMTVLHLHYSWLSMLAVTSCICGGFVCIIRRLLSLIRRLEESARHLRREVESRQQVNDKLRQSEERLALAFDATQDGIWDWDIATGDVLFSPKWFASLGYAPEEFRHHVNSWQQLVHPDDMPNVQAALRAHFDGQSLIYECENRLLTKAGTYRWNLDRGKVVARTEDGTPLRMVGTDIDITAHKQAEAALRHVQEQYAALVNAVDGIVWEADASSLQPLFLSQHVERLLGYSVEDWLTTPNSWRDRLHPKDRDWVVAARDAANAHYQPQDLEYRVLAADGRTVWVRDIATVSVQADGSLLSRGLTIDITAQKATENALRHSEQFLQSTLDALSAHIAILDETGTILAVNAAWRHFAVDNAFTDAACGVGMNYLAVSEAAQGQNAEEAARVAQGIREVVAHQREHFALEYPCHSADEQRWFVVRVTRFDDGSLPRLVMAHENITTQKQSEQELLESEFRFRDLLEGSLQGILIHRDNKALFVNQAYADMFGYESPDEIYTLKTLLWLIAPHERERLTGYRDARLAGKSVPCHYEYEGVRKDGSKVWLDMTVRVVSWAGQPALQSIVADISERKQVEEALRKSEQQFRQIAENMWQVLWMSESYTPQILYVSPAYETIWGRTCESLYAEARSWLEAMHPEDREIGYRSFERQRRGELTDVAYRIIRPDGTIRWIHDRAFPICDTSGQVYRIAGIAEDITERQQAEDERQRLEAQLSQSQKMEAMGTLAGGIAHDFNNILGVIVINTEVAKTLIAPNHHMQENLQNVLLAANRAKDFVQQILTFSRQIETQRQPVRLTLVIQDTLTLLRASLPTTIEIRQSLLEEGDTIFADPTQLQQIILNLCVNAEQAMRGRGGILEITLDVIELDDVFVGSHPALQPGRHLRLTISDSGHGMTPEVMERIFDPFFTTKGIGEGTGMGLARVHGMVAGHSGAITVQSRLGKGTIFSLYFPCLPVSVDQPTPAQDTISPGAGRLMVVDDEPMLASGMKMMLTHLGYEVTAYTSGQEALAVFNVQPERFDLVITDQTMPGMTGEQLARELRQRRSDIPIILCTGFSHVINAESAREQDMDAYFIKPVSIQQLTSKIQEVLEYKSKSVRPLKMRILLIDDDDQLRNSICRMLEAEGYEVAEARNGREGIRQYRDEPADVIITDILMPEREGIETIVELKYNFPEVKIIAISGGLQVGNIDILGIARQFGVKWTLQKPFSREELMIALRNVVQG